MQPSPVYISLKESFIQQIATLDSLYLMNETKNSKSGCSLWPRKAVNEGEKKKKGLSWSKSVHLRILSLLTNLKER